MSFAAHCRSRLPFLGHGPPPLRRPEQGESRRPPRTLPATPQAKNPPGARPDPIRRSRQLRKRSGRDRWPAASIERAGSPTPPRSREPGGRRSARSAGARGDIPAVAHGALRSIEADTADPSPVCWSSIAGATQNRSSRSSGEQSRIPVTKSPSGASQGACGHGRCPGYRSRDRPG